MVTNSHFPDQHSRSNPPNLYEMSRTDIPGAGLKFVIRNTKQIYNGHSQVYIASLTCVGHRSEDVVCKVAFGKRKIARLRHEAEIYLHLRNLQCDAIPACYGLFEGELEDGPSACLVTEYCGNTLETSFDCIDTQLRIDIIEALAKIHAAGVQHGDIREYNVVLYQNRQPTIIDFDRAEKHQCLCPRPILFDVTEPYRNEFGCNELYQICLDCDVWTPNMVRCSSGYHSACTVFGDSRNARLCGICECP
ncbi:kinase-like domain-containing protein [Sparassis latifolia]